MGSGRDQVGPRSPPQQAQQPMCHTTPSTDLAAQVGHLLVTLRQRLCETCHLGNCLVQLALRDRSGQGNAGGSADAKPASGREGGLLENSE